MPGNTTIVVENRGAFCPRRKAMEAKTDFSKQPRQYFKQWLVPDITGEETRLYLSIAQETVLYRSHFNERYLRDFQTGIFVYKLHELNAPFTKDEKNSGSAHNKMCQP